MNISNPLSDNISYILYNLSNYINIIDYKLQILYIYQFTITHLKKKKIIKRNKNWIERVKIHAIHPSFDRIVFFYILQALLHI